MVRGRPGTPLGAHGDIHYRTLDSGKVRARTWLKLMNGEDVLVQATATSKNKATNLIKERCQERLGGSDTGNLKVTSPISALMRPGFCKSGLTLNRRERLAPPTRCLTSHCVWQFAMGLLVLTRWMPWTNQSRTLKRHGRYRGMSFKNFATS